MRPDHARVSGSEFGLLNRGEMGRGCQTVRQLHSNANSPEAAAPVLHLTLYGLVHSTEAVNAAAAAPSPAAAIGADSHPNI